jgi:hypothetical protein
MSAVYDKLGVRFEYPENWTIEEASNAHGHGSVTVVSPGGAFWSLSIHPLSTRISRLTRAVLNVLRHEYHDLDAEEVQETVCEQRLEGYDVNFFCLDLTSTALVRGFRTEHATHVLLCQAEDREFGQVQRVFQAMTASLLRDRRQ